MSAGPIRESERGMILINVLLFVAIASAVVMLMISAEDGSLHRSARLMEASRARAAALGGETSAIVALRRDGVVAPETDNAREPWAQLATRGAPIKGGTFDLAIADAEDRYNINLLMRTDPAATRVAARLATALALPPDLVAGAAQYVRAVGPVSDLGPLEAAGLKPETLARLKTLVTALPYDTTINMNSVGEDLLGILLDDPAAAHALISLRRREGFLTPEDFLIQHVSPPPLAAFTSTSFVVRSRVTIGDTTQGLTSLLHRTGSGDRVAVRTIARRWSDRAAF